MPTGKDIAEQNRSKDEDNEIVRSILDGNRNDFAQLEKKYRMLITTLTRRMIKNEDDVQDLVQEAFIKVYKAIDKFQFGYSFSAWIYRITSNTCIDFLRKKRFQTISINNPVPSSDEEMEYEIEDREYIPDINVLYEERKLAISEAIENLPDNYKEIIRLRHEVEMDYKEIAEKLGLPLGTVKAHLFRARKLLYAALKKQVHLFKED